jgi:hypothetical protein
MRFEVVEAVMIRTVALWDVPKRSLERDTKFLEVAAVSISYTKA